MDTNLLKAPAHSKLKTLELFLLHLRYREGRLSQLEGNNPLLITDPDSAWIVYSGTVDVFSVPVSDGLVVGTRTHLFRGEAGQLLLGVGDGSNDSTTALLISGTPGTRLLQLPRSRLFEMARDMEYENLIATMINDWVMGLSCGLFSKVLPKNYMVLEANTEFTEAHTDIAITPKRGVVWVELCGGEAQINGEPDLTIDASHPVLPLAQFAWLNPTQATQLSVWDTPTMLAQQMVWPALEQFHAIVLEAINLNQSRESVAERSRLVQKAESERLILENAVLRLSSTLTEEVTFIKSLEAGRDALWAACTLVGDSLSIEISSPPASAMYGLAAFELVDKIAQASHIRVREVALRGDWWKQDNGPLLAFTQDNQPVALIPRSPTHYELVDPIKKTRIPINPQVADQLASLAYTFYRPFPNESLTAWRVITFGLHNMGPELRRLLMIGLSLGLLRLLPPIATGLIFNTYIPEANSFGLIQMGVALLIVAAVSGMFQIAQGTTLLRIQSKMEASVQAALWDRLLNLPLPFFRQYTSGVLGGRVMGVTIIRRILSGYVLNTMLTFVFTSFNIVLLFFYSVPLALLALGLILLASVVSIVTVTLDMRYQRELSEARGELSGLVLELLTGIAKLRITASENQAFSLWTERFVTQNKLYHHARKITNGLMTFNGVYVTFSSLLMFVVIVYSANHANLSTGDFLAFNLAFMQFLGAWLMMSNSLSATASVVPIFERLKPILDAQPEVDEVKVTPQPLTGAIEISHVSFRYTEKSPLALKDISMDIAPGEFIAFVGHSGSGKSTLLRLLLGFDHPETGGIFYDGQDLGDLDVREVRRHLGVVLQNSALTSGDIFENIVGTSNLTLEDAWEAARMVGLEDDLQQLPMGMNTLVTGRGSTLSGGQRQRIMIARAIVNRPRILLFDEATSALDNQTQQIVSRSLEGLQATRIVIAHRLSTIINADRIYVFHKGEIVQAGSYAELIVQQGPFAELAKRQMV